MRNSCHARAIEESIEAMQGLDAVHMRGVSRGDGGAEEFELWARSAPDGSRSEEFVMRLGSGAVVWAEEGETRVHVPRESRVYVDRARPPGFVPWIGRDFLGLVQELGTGLEVLRGVDPETGRNRAVVLCSLTTADGPQSLRLTFDVESKLLVALERWDSPSRLGAPQFESRRITYFRSLPDPVVAYRAPEGSEVVDRTLYVREALLPVLETGAGSPIPDGDLDGAARVVVRRCWEAVVSGDAASFRRLCPATEAWSDEALRALVLAEGKPYRTVELLEVGPASIAERNRLGSVLVVPATLRTADGNRRELRLIVQCREGGTARSCVVAGPAGPADGRVLGAR